MLGGLRSLRSKVMGHNTMVLYVSVIGRTSMLDWIKEFRIGWPANKPQ